MSLDISSLLQASGINSISDLRNVINNATDEQLSSAVESFSQLLTDETGKFADGKTQATEDSELEELVNALDKSILGNSMTSIDSKDLLRELQNDSKREEVIKELTSGQMMGIVLTDSDSDDDIQESITTGVQSQEETTESLADSLQTILAGIGQITAN